MPPGDRLCVYRVGEARPVTVIRLAGPLDTDTVTTVRQVLLHSFDTQRAPVIVDLSPVTDVDETAVTILARTARRAGQLPGTTVLVCAPHEPLTRRLTAVPSARQLTVYPCFEAALAAARRQPVPHQVRLRLAPTLQAPASARRVVADACTDWGITGLTGTAQVVATEMVTNATVHARTDMEVAVLLWGDRLHLSVRDWAPEPVAPRTVDHTAESGRGLLLIDALTESWGCVPTSDGKVVWAAIPVDGA